MSFAHHSSLLAFSHFLCYSQAIRALLVLYFWVGDFVYILGPFGSLQQTLLRAWEFFPSLQPPQVFLVRGCEACIPRTGTLGCKVCLAPQFVLLVYLHANVAPSVSQVTASPGPPAATLPTQVLQPLPCCACSLPQLPLRIPPTGLDECFFFNSLVVGLPYSSTFCQFWVFFFFTLNLLSLF